MLQFGVVEIQAKLHNTTIGECHIYINFFQSISIVRKRRWKVEVVKMFKDQGLTWPGVGCVTKTKPWGIQVTFPILFNFFLVSQLC